MEKLSGNKEFEKYLWKMINKYTPILLLNNFTFEVSYGVENKSSLMESITNYPYLNGKFNYGDTIVQMWKDGKNINDIIIHEMCHLMTDPLYCKAIQRYVTMPEVADERERLTDFIANIIIKNKL